MQRKIIQQEDQNPLTPPVWQQIGSRTYHWNGSSILRCRHWDKVAIRWELNSCRKGSPASCDPASNVDYALRPADASSSLPEWHNAFTYVQYQQEDPEKELKLSLPSWENNSIALPQLLPLKIDADWRWRIVGECNYFSLRYVNEIVQLEESTARRKYIAVSPTAVVTMETWSPLNTLHLQTHLRPKSSNNILLLGQMINETLHEKESAAVRIQYWWRRELRKRDEVAQRTASILSPQGISHLSDSVAQLTQQLHQLQQERRRQEDLYERIIQLPARHINLILAREANYVPSDDQTSIQYSDQIHDHAARIIQRTIRRYGLERSAAKMQQRMTRFSAKRRMELMNLLERRISKSRVILTTSLAEIHAKKAEHKSKLPLDCLGMARREACQKHIERLIAEDVTGMKNVPSLRDYHPSTRSALLQHKAERLHFKTMQEINRSLIDIQ